MHVTFRNSCIDERNLSGTVAYSNLQPFLPLWSITSYSKLYVMKLYYALTFVTSPWRLTIRVAIVPEQFMWTEHGQFDLVLSKLICGWSGLQFIVRAVTLEDALIDGLTFLVGITVIDHQGSLYVQN